jgi:hypothetical protein
MNTSSNKLDSTQIGIIVLTIATAAIHFFVAYIFPSMRTLFIAKRFRLPGAAGGIFFTAVEKRSQPGSLGADRFHRGHYCGVLCG